MTCLERENPTIHARGTLHKGAAITGQPNRKMQVFPPYILQCPRNALSLHSA